MNQTFHFIACSNRPFLMAECRRYADRLYIPEGWNVEWTVITDALSMTSGYNRAIGLHPGDAARTADAPVRIYLHQDVFLTNRWILHNLRDIFSAHPDIGMLGVAGAERMHPSGVWWSGASIGCVYREDETPYEEERLAPDVHLQDVAVVDGFFLATAVDLPWREELFDGFDFYDVSQSYEMRRAGYRVVIPEMRYHWAVHDDGKVLSLDRYNHYRKVFLEHYEPEQS
ncbi:MAG: glycosyltransferase family protein [Lachnospiraceae bacterium]|nr:glycosyltransferase family protein [Lachnospiraceae bacterium]